MFEEESEYLGPITTVGELTQGFLVNTTSLRKANNKLNTICIAADRCEDEDGR